MSSNLCPLPTLAPSAIPISTGSIGFLDVSNSISSISPGLMTKNELLNPVVTGVSLSCTKLYEDTTPT